MQWIKHILVAAVILPILVIGAWAVTDVIVHETGDAGFCGTCHAMRPMVAAYREDIHGGAGDQGLQAACTDCHTPHDNPINHLWSKAYYDPARKMKEELEEKGLLKDNPWSDEFQLVFYHLWHHEGRRARMGALHGAADYAHWHGFFELMQDIYKLEEIYDKRIETGEIE